MKEVRVAASAGFCFGVKRSVEMAEKLLAEKGSCISYGELIHNEDVVAELMKRGLRIASSLADIGEGDRVIIRAHGVSEATVKSLEAAGAVLSDATCPKVKRIHNIVHAAAEEGSAVLVIGMKNHPEVEAICGWCGECFVAENAAETEAFLNEHPEFSSKSLCVVVQTTQTQSNFNNCVKILKKRCTNAKIFDTICLATSTRQNEATELASTCDAMIVIGGRHSANSVHLAEICRERCRNVRFIERAEELDLDAFADSRMIGITAGASTPSWIIKEVRNKMDEVKVEESTVFEEAAKAAEEAAEAVEETVTAAAEEAKEAAAEVAEEAAEAVQAATTISYSVNNQIWVTDVTELGRVDAGTDVIYVKAENPYCADAATTKAYLEVTAKPITITANDQSRAYGVSNEDGLSIGTTVANAAEVTIDGLVNETDAMKMIVQLTVSDRMYPADKAVGEYERAIAVSALLDASIRENYTVTYVPGTLTITNGEPDEDEINVQGYEGIYDADYHTVSVEAPEGATVYYSTDGENWTEDANDVAQKDVHYGVDMVEPVAYTVYYKVVQENYNDITGETGIFIYPASVDVYAVDAEKDYGTDDPELTYNVEGLLGDDTLDCIKVTVEREAGEDPGYYQINVSGEALQGNYSVGYEPAVFTIHEVEEETYTLTIHYVDQNGNPVAAEYVGTYNAGDAFNITSPTVEGYTPEYGYVQSGENGMPARDVEITIVYTQVIPGAEENIPVAEDDTTTPPQNPTDDDADATDDTTRDTTTTGTGGATTATAGNAATATQETIVDESTPGGATLDVDEDGEVTLVPEEDTALAAGLGEGFMFNGLYFVFLLIAALVYLFYTDNMKKHQVKIQEMIKERDNK